MLLCVFLWLQLWQHAAAAVVILRRPLRLLRCDAKPWMDMHMTGSAELDEHIALHQPSVKSTTTPRQVSTAIRQDAEGSTMLSFHFIPLFNLPPCRLSIPPSQPWENQQSTAVQISFTRWKHRELGETNVCSLCDVTSSKHSAWGRCRKCFGRGRG